MRIRAMVLPLMLVLGGSLFAACKGGGGEALPECPSGGTMLTYENFGKDFLSSYCTSCHTSGSGVGEAQDIPLDTQSAVQARINDIYEQAGGTNTEMPPSGIGPTADERQQLEEWLSCGAK